MRRLAYLPFSLAAGMIGSLVGRRAFRAVWERIADQAGPPSPSAPELPLGRVALAAALEAATLAACAAVARQLAARVFHRLFGAWPVSSRSRRLTSRAGATPPRAPARVQRRRSWPS